jgi:methylated-DNA-protein-cysteine methyltransferase-like protein
MDRETRSRRIVELIENIPVGHVASYGQIAQLAGLPRGARQVAYTLRHVGGGPSLPWHRVLRSSGHIAFPPGSPEFARQEKRLVAEGIDVVRGRVDIGRYGWRPDLDELLWKPSSSWDEG